MSVLSRLLGAIAILCVVSACQITGAAPPSSQQTTGMNRLGGPGSGAP